MHQLSETRHVSQASSWLLRQTSNQQKAVCVCVCVCVRARVRGRQKQNTVFCTL
jgi:hypothetical protein